MTEPERSDVPRTMYGAGYVDDLRDEINRLKNEAQASREATVLALAVWRDRIEQLSVDGCPWGCDGPMEPPCEVHRLLADSSSMAQAYRERLVAPWREALRIALRIVLDNDDWGAMTSPERRQIEALLDTPEGSE